VQETFTLKGELHEIIEHYMDKGWTDGLPVIPPTKVLLERFLQYTDREPSDVVAAIPPNRADATVEAVAVNAIMAGCKPQYLPAVIAGVEAIADPLLNVYSLQATTNPVAVAVMLNGPIAKELEVNARGNCLGPGFRANATIGRAVHLVMLNIGGGIPQLMDKSSHGQPGKFTMCFAENEGESPWEPWHVEHGFDRETSTVTAIGVTGTANIVDPASKTARDVLRTFASSCSSVGAQNTCIGGWPLIIFGPEHAAIIANEGYSKLDVKRWLYENSRTPNHAFPEGMLRYKVQHRRPKWLWSDDPMFGVPLADSAEGINIVVAGSEGPHSVFSPSFGEPSSPAIRPIALKDGTPVQSVEQFRN
jgi:hypothetical protein